MRTLTNALFAVMVAGASVLAGPGHFTGPIALDGLANDKDFVTSGADEFVAKNSRFSFTSASKDVARSYGKLLPPGETNTFAGHPLVEALVRFEPAGNEATLIVYSVGDMGEISEVKFEEMVEGLTGSLTKSHGKPATPAAAASVVVRAKSLSWKCPAGTIRLEWSSTRANSSRGQNYRAEFIRIVIAPLSPVKAVVGKPTKWIPAEQLRSNPTGDKWIGTVPMVDQGQKGYCAVATSERVLRYYGKDVDQHELAQACQTDQGTNAQKFEEQMKRIATRFGLRFQVHLSGVDERFITDIVKDYAKAGRRKGGIACPPQLEQYPLYFYQAIDSLNAGQLISIRQADKSGISRMERYVRESIDRAEPLIWCVQLGIVTEPGLPQSRGGHMRLIIGYNPKTSEVLYTDSWGQGHELKRMKLVDAWAMTFGVHVMKPN